jgi:hypothetical protein
MLIPDYLFVNNPINSKHYLHFSIKCLRGPLFLAKNAVGLVNLFRAIGLLPTRDGYRGDSIMNQLFVGVF